MMIDLHGLTQDEAIGKIQNAIFSARRNNYSFINIITGNGTGTLKYLLEEYCNNNNLEYKKINSGHYKIYIQ